MKDERPSADKKRGIFLSKDTSGESVTSLPERVRPKAAVARGLFIFILLLITGTAYAGGIMDLTKAVIHHTADRDTNKNQTVEEIDAYHKSKDWDGIGYHFLIRKDGKIYNGRPIWKNGAHARTGRPYSRNHYIGIALTGYDKFTNEQISSLKILLSTLQIKKIERHHEECPGVGLDVEKIQMEMQIEEAN